jgi:hypothetical protein
VSEGVSVAKHPRASASVTRWKGLGGLGGFLLAGAASKLNGAVAFEMGWRALVGGVAGYLVAWAVSVTVWRHLLRAHVRAAVIRAAERRRAAAQAAQADSS